MTSQWQSVALRDIESQLAPLSRRRFLVYASKGACLLGAVPLLGCDSGGKASTGRALTAQQVDFFNHLANLLLPTGSQLTPLSEIPLIANLDQMFSQSSEEIRGNLGVAINLFEYGGWFLGGRFSRFTRLQGSEAVAYIDEWQNGHYMQQGIITILKKLVYASYWQDERTWSPLAFDGPVSDNWGLKSLGDAPLPKV